MSEFGQNIGVFYEPPEKEVSVRAPLKKPEVAMDGDKVVEKKEITEKEKWKEFISDIFSPLNTSASAQKILNTTTWIKDDTRETIQILIDTGEFDFANKASTIWNTAFEGAKNVLNNKSIEIDKGRRLEEMQLAIQKAEEGLGIHIMLSNHENFTSDNIRNYEKKVYQNVSENLNQSVVKGLFGIYKNSGENSRNTFNKDTWANIGLYIESRFGNTELTKGLSEEDKTTLKNLALEKQRAQEKEIAIILNPIIEKLGANDDKKLQKLLTDHKIDRDANGNISIIKRLEAAKGKKEMDEVLKELSGNTDKLLNDANKLLNESDTEIKKQGLEGKSIKQVLSILKNKLKHKIHPEKQKKIEEIINSKNLKESTPVINQLTQKQSQLTIQTLNEVLKEVGDTQDINEEKILIDSLFSIAGKQNIAQKNIAKAGNNHDQIKAIQNANGDLENAKKNLQITGERKEEVGVVAQNQSILSRQEKALQKLGIRNIKDANEEIKKLSEIEKQRELTDDESARKNICLSYLETQKALSQNYIDIRAKFGEKAAQDIITDTGRFISNDPKKTYNFASREAIGIINNPESTPQERAFAKIEIGQSLPISELFPKNMPQYNVPEMNMIKIIKEENNMFSIPGIGVNTPIDTKERDEWGKIMKKYCDLGLSQFIPHLNTITVVLKEDKSINTDITEAGQQQEILKYLYSQLFTDKLITSSLPDVENAFHSKMKQAPNMRNAMQETLELNGLINEPGQPIGNDTFKAWLRGNRPTKQNPLSINI